MTRAGATPQIWSLELPVQEYVSPNRRVHWTVRSTLNRGWREAACWLARAQRIPACSKVRVRLEYWPADRRRRDPDNLVSGVLKPVVDGLVDAGVIADDTAAYVVRDMPVIHPPRDDRRPRWLLTVTAVEG